MKKLPVFLVLVLSFIFTQINAQSCYSYVPEKIGSRWEITSYNTKEKIEGVTKYQLLNKTTSGSKVTYKIKVQSYDKKGQELFNSIVDASCENGHYSVDMESVLNMSMMNAYKDMDVKIESTPLEIPSTSTAVGTELKEASVVMEMNAGIILKMKVSFEDRKLAAKEKKTTSAGTFDCIKITQNTVTTGIVKMKSSSIDWYAEGVGQVRSEIYNAKGKLTSYTELTKLE